MKKVIGLVLGLVPVSAFAECVPVPDCASIGYTETSCDGGSLKCPFDTTKLKCIPCDSSFRFACDGDNIESSIGRVCNGKYVSCTCSSSDYVFLNGKCVCDTSCKVGAIYYSDGTCNQCVDNTLDPIGIVALTNNSSIFILSLEETTTRWSVDLKDDNGNKILGACTSLANLYNDETILDFNAKGSKLTELIAQTYGNNTNFAAGYCKNYYPDSFENLSKKWFVPARMELYNAFLNTDKINESLSKLGKALLGDTNYWTSNEVGQWDARIQKTNGYGAHMNKTSTAQLRCFMQIQ